MTHFLISFPASAMDHLSPEGLAAASDASHAVVREAKAAGVWVFGGGLNVEAGTVRVEAAGSAAQGLYPEHAGMSGGFTVLDVPDGEEAGRWAAKIAAACQCAQEVREFWPGSSS